MRNEVRLFLAALACLALAGCDRAPAEAARAPAQAATRIAQAPAPTPPAEPQPQGPVRADPREALSDTIITTRIKAGILSDPGMAGADVSVNTDRGVVSLTGIIKSQEQAAIASAHASRQDGVMRVENHLAVNLR